MIHMGLRKKEEKRRQKKTGVCPSSRHAMSWKTRAGRDVRAYAPPCARDGGCEVGAWVSPHICKRTSGGGGGGEGLEKSVSDSIRFSSLPQEREGHQESGELTNLRESVWRFS